MAVSFPLKRSAFNSRKYMYPTIYRIKKFEAGELSVMAKPVSGEWIEDEFQGLKMLGVDVIVSLLELAEAREVGLSEELDLCLKNGIEFINFPIPDRGLPDTEKAKVLSKQLLSEINGGKHIVIHCRAGIGRTGIISGAVLKESGIDTKSAIDIISESRGVQVPDTIEQENWLFNYSLI